MQMLSICRCKAYGYAKHILSSPFPAEIRKKAEPEVDENERS